MNAPRLGAFVSLVFKQEVTKRRDGEWKTTCHSWSRVGPQGMDMVRWPFLKRAAKFGQKTDDRDLDEAASFESVRSGN